MKPPSRLCSLDLARAVAATSVVFWHWRHFFMSGDVLVPDFDSTRQPLYRIFRIFYDHGWMAVPFFFQLSGFVFFWLYRDRIARGQCGAWRFAVLRFARLYPLHLLTLISVALLQALWGQLVGGYFVYPYNDAFHFFIHVMFASGWGFECGYSFNAPVWSVSVEIGLYALFFVFCITRLPDALKLVLVLVVAGLMTRLGIGGPWAPAALAFFLGGLVYVVTAEIYLSRQSWQVDMLFVVAAIAGWVGVFADGRVEQLLLLSQRGSLLVLFPISIASLAIAETRFPRFATRVGWIGDLTYSSYLIHFPLQLGFMLIALGLGLGHRVFLEVWVLLAYLALLFGLSALFFYRFERPMQEFIRAKLLPDQECPRRLPE